MTSGATYSSVPTKEFVRTEGCAASSMPPARTLLPLHRALLPLLLPRAVLPLLRASAPGEGGGEAADDASGVPGAEGGATISGATLAAPVPAKERSKSVSWQWPEGRTRMFSGFRSLHRQKRGERRGEAGLRRWRKARELQRAGRAVLRGRWPPSLHHSKEL